jgi:glutathione synthase/RimK-type ligase-like ATP-grasp enzyme
VSTLPYRGTQPPVPLLLLVSSGDGNIPTASFLDDRIFLTSVVVADFMDPSAVLPPHRLIFNAIGDADQCRPALEAAARLVKRSGAPVVNDPAAVLKTGRAENAGRLGKLSGVRAPRMATLPRALLVGAQAAAKLGDHGIDFPLLLRSPGFHTGRNFAMANGAGDLPDLVGGLPGDELLAIEYLDAKDRDGNARKYRAMIVDGKIYPMHLALSRHWKVHYFTADMANNTDHRGHDAAFLDDMTGVIGSKAVAALERIRDTLGLDYGGIDFGLSPSGEVLVFEANATMVVNPPEADVRWVYRRAGVSRILDAVTAMIARRSAKADLQKTG